MNKCDWCGRTYKDGGVSDGFLIGHNYCSKKCRNEAKQSKASDGGSKSSIIWWIIAIVVLLIIVL